MATLATQKLSVKIGNVAICADLDLEVAPGQCWGLLGRNGAGKTTLLHTLAGLRAPLAGKVILGNRALSELPRRKVPNS